MSPFVRLAAAALTSLALLVPAAAAVDVKAIKSPGGIDIWLVEERGLPIISIDAAFEGGAQLDPVGKAGLAYLTSTLMNEGAGDLDSTAFQKKLEENAIYFGGTAGADSFGLSLTTLTANRDVAFAMMADAIAKPRFDEEAIARMKAQIETSYRAREQDPDSVSSMAWFARAFAGHPYAMPVSGNDETLAAITRADIQAFMASALGRDKLHVVMVGDIGPGEAGPLADFLFGSLPATRMLSAPGPAVMANAGKLDVIEKDVPQSAVFFAGPGVDVRDPAFRAAQIMNYVLGGGSFSSRLMQEVREKRGLTYGISTGLSDRKLAPLLVGSVATDNARVKETIEITKAEIARLRDGGITEQELTDAKAFLTGSYPLGFDSNGKIAGRLLDLKMDGFDAGFVNRRNDEVMAVTLDQVNAAAKALLDPEKFYFVVVGKPEGLGTPAP